MKDPGFIATVNETTRVEYQNGCYVAKLPEMAGTWWWVFCKMGGPYKKGKEILFIDMNKRPASLVFKPYQPEFKSFVGLLEK